MNLWTALCKALKVVPMKDISRILSSQYTSSPQYTIEDAKSYKALVDAFTSWTYITVDKIARNVGLLPLTLYYYKQGGKARSGHQVKSRLRQCENKGERRRMLKMDGIEKQALDTHPFLDLIRCPNFLMPRMSFWYHLVARLELTGACGIYFARNGIGKIPSEMWPLPLMETGTLKAVADSLVGLKGWRYEDGSVQRNFTLDECRTILYPNPSSPFEGKSPVLAQVYPYQIDDFLMKQQYYYLKNRSVFGNVFETEQRLTDAQVTSLKAQMASQYEAAVKAGMPLFLHSGLKISSNSLVQPEKLPDVTQTVRDRLITTHGLTPGHAGVVPEVNRATAETNLYTFVTECLRPKTMFIEEFFETQVLPWYDDRLLLDFELPNVEDQAQQLTERASNLEHFYTTVNEERAKNGLDPVEWGDKPLASISIAPLGEGWGSSPAVPPEVGPVDDTEPAEDTPDEPDEEKVFEPPTDKQSGAPVRSPDRAPPPLAPSALPSTKATVKSYWTQERKDAAWYEFKANTEAWEKMFVAQAIVMFRREEKEVLDALQANGKAIGATFARWTKEKILASLDKKDSTASVNIDEREEKARVKAQFLPVFVEVMNRSGDARMRYLATTGMKARLPTPSFAFNVNDPKTRKWLGDRLDEFSDEVVGTTKEKIKAVLRSDYSEGLSTTQTADHLREMFASFEQYRAPLIARTETIAASNYADVEAVRQSGLGERMVKHWLSARDANVRQSHKDADKEYGEGKGIDIEDDFVIEGDSMNAPGNGSSAEQNINCRCSVYYDARPQED